jgi:hypothetical protein
LLINSTRLDLIDALFDVIHLDLHLRVRRIVESEARCRVEINEAGDFIREATADRTQLPARE